MATGGQLEFWWLDWSKYKNDARNGFSKPKLVGKVVLHSFQCQFVFNFHFHYGRRRPFWILSSHKFRRHFREGHGGKIFSKYFKEPKSSVKPYYALSGHGTPRLHPTNPMGLAAPAMEKLMIKTCYTTEVWDSNIWPSATSEKFCIFNELRCGFLIGLADMPQHILWPIDRGFLKVFF